MLQHTIIFHTVLLSLFFTISTTFAQTCRVSLDSNPEIEGLSPPPSHVIAGETFFVSVTIQNVLNLHSYSVKCRFDSQIVGFNCAVTKLSPSLPAFLESRQGHIAAFLSIPGNNEIEIAATQTGNDSTLTAQGDGVLGYLSFTAKTTGDPQIKLQKVHLVEPDGKNISATIH